MTEDHAITIALGCVTWLAKTDDQLSHFLGASGMFLNTLTDQLETPEVLAAVLDFILMEDAWVLEAAASCAVAPEQIFQARQHLPGGDVPNWT